MITQFQGFCTIPTTSCPIGYLSKKDSIAGAATKKVSRVNPSTISVSVMRSDIIVPTTSVKGFFSLSAIYVHRHISPRRGNTRFSAYVPKIEHTTAISGGLMPRLRNCIRQRKARNT